MIDRKEILDAHTDAIFECKTKFETKREIEACIEGVNIFAHKLLRR